MKQFIIIVTVLCLTAGCCSTPTAEKKISQTDAKIQQLERQIDQLERQVGQLNKRLKELDSLKVLPLK